MRILGLFLVVTLFSLSAHSQTKRALIVAIDNYPKGSGWEKMHGTNDSRLIEKHLLSTAFSSRNIRKLHNEQATKKNIVNELKQLHSSCSADDYVHIHFSCHGQQMIDDNGDEEDGLDEALIPYDAQFWYKPGIYEGANHLRDDELGVWIKNIREKTGGKGTVMITLDACHSGTANRVYGDKDYIRGTGYIFAPDDYFPEPVKNQELSLHLKPAPHLASAHVFSACLAEEINYEYFSGEESQYYGRLTYAFVKSKESMPKGTTIKELFTAMQDHNDKLTKNKKKKQTFYSESSNPNSDCN